MDPLFRILSKVNRDWVFGWKMRNRLFRYMGVNLPKDSSRVYIGRETWIDDLFPELVTIGDGVRIGWRCLIFAHNASTMPQMVSPVTIEKGALLGHCVTVMPGVTIGECAQVGCNALVTKDIEPYTIAVGVPAKPIRKVTDEELKMR